MAEDALASASWPELVRRVRARTPARVLMGRSGAAYRTSTQLDLRQDHAAARDTVRAELSLEDHFDDAFRRQWQPFEVCTQAATKDEYLLRPDLGRHFNQQSRSELVRQCSRGLDLPT